MTDADADPPARKLRDLAAQRAGDADRDAVAEMLRIAAGEGRIDLSELEERLGLVNAAKTYGELDLLVADLPQPPPSLTLSGPGTDPDTLVLSTTTANISQAGHWVVPKLITAESTTGWITIDFTRAYCRHQEVTVEVVTKTGWIQLILPEGWAARIGPLKTYSGHISNKALDTPDPGAPTVIVTGDPVFGYIKVRQRYGRRS
jgi:Domain of unknown function (DUF1707)